ncbi:MAG: DHH family phosphoesterase [Acidobacteriia bacterium]|nr:DHH family phosphoesterase [Terriglobia bacterium]
MTVRICFHDQCFDGACSAAVFTRFYRECVNPRAELRYRGLIHRAGRLFDEDVFDGDENAIVDFKYSPSARLTWWFDHHQSAFLAEADAEHFRRDHSGKKFYGPDFRSCTKFIAHIAATKFAFHAPDLEELIQWADIIDGAQYPDAQTAVEMRHPAMQLTLVMEGMRTEGFVADLIPELVSKPLAEIAAMPAIRAAFEQFYARHLKTVEIIRERAAVRDGVAFFDMSDQGSEGFNKFVPYYLFPETVYSVALSRGPERAKIAVGSNPWNPAPKAANLASICERYGGGGHPKVAAISLPPDQLERAREVARQIVDELRASVK